MEYALIICFQLLGVCFHVMQKVIKMDDEHPDINRREVFRMFFKHDWDTLIVSGLILVLHLVCHFAIDKYTPDFRSSINYYILYAFVAAFMLGYLGQRAFYKWLGTAEKKIDIMIDNKTK